jgi:hypothetical protein
MHSFSLENSLCGHFISDFSLRLVKEGVTKYLLLEKEKGLERVENHLTKQNINKQKRKIIVQFICEASTKFLWRRNELQGEHTGSVTFLNDSLFFLHKQVFNKAL